MQVSTQTEDVQKPVFPERFIDLKRQLVDIGPEGKERLVKAWNDLLQELAATRRKLKEKDSEVRASSCFRLWLLQDLTNEILSTFPKLNSRPSIVYLRRK